MDLWNFLLWFSAIAAGIYLFVKRRYSYWSRRNIVYVEPKFPVGSFKFFGQKDHFSLQLGEIYQQYREKTSAVGLYFFFSPVLLVTDTELIRSILIKDFQHFQDRGTYYNEKHDPLSAHLFNVEYDRWKPLRSKLTPTFTSGKMKFMFSTVVAVADEFVNCIDTLVKTDNEMEIYDLLGRFTTDVIGTCAFGIECNSLKDPDAKFRQMGKKIFDQPRITRPQRVIITLYKDLARALGIVNTHDDVAEFFLGIVEETVKYRETNNVRRNDFMDLLIELKNNPVEEGSNDLGNLTLNEIAAQAFVFFLAGFETSSTTLSFVLYELSLAHNKHIQDKARKEVQMVMEKHNNNLTYEVLSEMSYIEQIINESLRKHPPGAIIVREATKDYVTPDQELTIPKGQQIFIPVYGIHHDPTIYENPEEFRPERFSAEQVKQRQPGAFMPFGDGPRNCVGLRFAMLEMRIALVKLLQQFEFTACSRTSIPMKYVPRKIVLSSVNGVWLRVDKIKQN